MNYEQLDERTLLISGKEVKFGQSVKEILDLGDRLVVRLYVDDFEVGDMMVGRNIVAYDEDGNELWRVEDHGLRRPAAPDVPDAFFDIHVDEKGRLWGGTPGVELMIDLETGKILDAEPRW